jgi:putative transposase
VVLVAAQGEAVEPPRHSPRLAKGQRRVSRRKTGRNRRKKAAILLAKAHQTVKRQRADFHH